MLKKINAILAFITAAGALVHTVLMGLLMLGQIGFNPVFNKIGRGLLGVFTLHILISIIIMFFTGGNGLKYPKLNKSTIEQRIASILLLLFIHFHMYNYFVDGAPVKQSIFGFVTEILFTVIIMCHFMPSLDKGLITLGIYGKGIMIVLRAVTLIAFIFTLVSVSIYFLGAIA